MTKRYTLAFRREVRDIEPALDELKRMGVQIESAQRVIGTAIVSADATQVKRLRKMSEIAGVTETAKISAS